MKLKITQTKSTIAALKNHKANIQALGLHHVGDTVVKEDNPYPEKAVDPMTKTVTITWKSPYPPLLIIN